MGRHARRYNPAMGTIITDSMDLFLSALTNYSSHTLIIYRRALLIFERSGVALDNDCLVAFDRWMTRPDSGGAPGWHSAVGTRAYSQGTRRLYVVALGLFLQWSQANGRAVPGVDWSTAQARLRISRGRTKAHPPPRRADPRIPQIVAYYDRLPEGVGVRRLVVLRNRAICHVLISTAARASELIGMDRGHLRPDGSITVLGKGNKARTVMLSLQAMAAVQAYLAARSDSHPALFVGHRRADRRIDHTLLQDIVKSAARALCLAPDTSAHSFRHWTATDMINHDVPMPVIQEYLGHANIQTTISTYAHVMPETVRRHVREYQATVGIHSLKL